MKRYLLLLAAFLLASCANKSMTRYDELAPTLEKMYRVYPEDLVKGIKAVL